MTNILLLNFLKQRGTPIKRHDLANELGISERELRADITELNKDGYPVLSGQKGIFYCDKVETIEGWARFFRRMGLSNIQKANFMDNIASKTRERTQEKIFTENVDAG